MVEWFGNDPRIEDSLKEPVGDVCHVEAKNLKGKIHHTIQDLIKFGTKQLNADAELLVWTHIAAQEVSFKTAGLDGLVKLLFEDFDHHNF